MADDPGNVLPAPPVLALPSFTTAAQNSFAMPLKLRHFADLVRVARRCKTGGGGGGGGGAGEEGDPSLELRPPAPPEDPAALVGDPIMVALLGEGGAWGDPGAWIIGVLLRPIPPPPPPCSKVPSLEFWETRKGVSTMLKMKWSSLEMLWGDHIAGEFSSTQAG